MTDPTPREIAEETLYLVMSVSRWEDIEVRGIPPFPTDHSGLPGVGFCAVFDSYEDAEREYPGREILPMRTKA